MIPQHHRRSLEHAGIGPLFHDQTYDDYGPLGIGLREWVKTNGPALAGSGGGVIFHGINMTDALQLVAKTFHLNGQGVRVMTLRKLAKTLARPASDIQREEMNDAPVLFLSPAQSGKADRPVTAWEIADIEEYIQARINRGQIVLLYWATDAAIGADSETHRNWWSEEFLHWIQKRGSVVTGKQLIEEGRKA